MDFLHRSPLSPFRAQVVCAALRSKPPDDSAAVLNCSRAKGTAALWLGTLASLAAFAYRAHRLRQSKDKREPFAWYFGLLPFAAALLYSFMEPMLAYTAFTANRDAFVVSKMSATEWMNARANDDRTLRSTNTSILCAFIVAAAGFLNSQITYTRSLAARASTATATTENSATAGQYTALTRP